MATKEEYLRWAESNSDKADSPEWATVNRAYLKEYGDVLPRQKPRERKSSPLGAALSGFGQGISFGFSDEAAAGLAAAVKRPFSDRSLGDLYSEQLAIERGNLSAAIEESPLTTMGGQLAGGLVLALSPAGRGFSSRMGTTQAASTGARALRSAGEGAAYGAAYGAGTAEGGERLEGAAKGAGLGAAIGGAIPLVAAPIGAMGRTLRNLADPWLPGGIDRSVRRAVADTVDDPAALVRELRSGGTAEQAIARTGEPRLAALAASVRGRGESARPAAEAVAQEQAGRLQAIRTAGGATGDTSLPQTLQAARSARSEATGPLYEAARESGVRVNARPTLKVIDQLIKGDPRSSVVPMLNQVKQLISPEGGGPAGAVSNDPRILISAYREIGNMFKNPQTGQSLPETQARALTLIRRSLERQIEEAVPEFRQANELFQQMSVPVNRAQIAQSLEQKLTSPLAAGEESIVAQRASSFSGALADEPAFIRRALGWARNSGLKDYFDEDALANIYGVNRRLQQDAEFKRLVDFGREGASRVVGDLTPEPLLNPLDRTMMIINGILKRSGSSREGKSLDRLSELMLDPNKLADLMEMATPTERAQINTLFKNPAAVTAPATAVSVSEP